ncbi:MAG: toll/interleukin-1 receptor domain-containing protein, partial [Chlorobiaceae bacterium]
MEQTRKDFFISYTRADQQQAEWIARILKEADYTVIIQAWDFYAGGNFVLQMQKALENTERTIAVLSPKYLDSVYARPEWAATFAKDPTGEKGLLIPVRIEKCELRGLLNAIIYIDLVNLSDEAAKNTLLQKIQQTIGFSITSTPQTTRYRGTLPPVWNIPRRNPNFTGRDTLLAKLRESLTREHHTALTQQAIYGLGGIGKTQLAIEYTYLNSSSYEYAWW